MSDTNQVSLRYVEEVTEGTTPASPALTELKITGTSDMGFTPETTVSEIIRSDRQENDLILVNGTVGGQFDTELISGVHDDLIEGVLWSDPWSTETEVITAGANVSITDLAGTALLADADLGGTLGAGAAVGDWFEVVQGSGEPSYYRAVQINSADAITVEGAISETSGTDITVTRGSSVVNGDTRKSFTFEKAYLDQSTVSYEYLRGMVPGTFSLSVSSSSIVTGAFGFTGATHEATTTRVATPSEVNQSGFTFNASSNVAKIGEGGSEVSLVNELSFEVTNNLREKNAVGTLGAFGIGAGTFSVSGSIQTYFEDITLLNKLINNTQTSLNFVFSDGAGGALVIDFPAIKFSEGVPEVSGKNEDVLLNLGFQAFADATLGYTMKVTRFTA